MANRLVRESSPYLKQHADNPVDWYPWGEEAFHRSREEDKPIHLSVAYACHWCHVMAHESFENPEIARLMNERLVNIKVDRQERPDIDDVYQKVVQMMGQGGGWPLTVFMTSNREPFFGGTYFPSEDRHGRPGFGRLVVGVSEAWREDREALGEKVEEFRRGYQRVEQRYLHGAAPADEEVPAAAGAAIRREHRPGARRVRQSAPKFPNPSYFTPIAVANYLRNHSEAVHEYARLKHQLAGQHRNDREAYTAAKAQFIEGAMTEAEGWARNVGWTIPNEDPQ